MSANSEVIIRHHFLHFQTNFFSVCPGFGRSSTSSPCEICLVGWYQPDEANQRCISCGSGSTTMSEGATNENECSKPILSQRNLRMIHICIFYSH